MTGRDSGAMDRPPGTLRGPGAGIVVERAERLSIRDAEIRRFLTRVYVGEGFVEPEHAPVLFRGAAPRALGMLLIVRRPADGALIGTVVVVPPGSPGCRFDRPDEAELQLLAVAPEHRGLGIGRALVRAALAESRRAGYPRMVLRSQSTMHAAHHIYSSAGFTRAPGRDLRRGKRVFLVFERAL